MRRLPWHAERQIATMIFFVRCSIISAARYATVLRLVDDTGLSYSFRIHQKMSLNRKMYPAKYKSPLLSADAFTFEKNYAYAYSLSNVKTSTPNTTLCFGPFFGGRGILVIYEWSMKQLSFPRKYFIFKIADVKYQSFKIVTSSRSLRRSWTQMTLILQLLKLLFTILSQI